MRQEQDARLSEALRALADETSGAQAPPALEAALRAEFRAIHRRTMHRSFPLWVWASAAAVVLVLVVAVSWRSSPTPAGPVAVLPKVVPEAPYQAAPLPTRLEAPVARSVSLRPGVVEPELEPLSPWYYNTALPEARLGHVVRVEVSRQAARQFGLLIPSGGPEMVKADVWIGDDGITRAIRFVR